MRNSFLALDLQSSGIGSWMHRFEEVGDGKFKPVAFRSFSIDTIIQQDHYGNVSLIVNAPIDRFFEDFPIFHSEVFFGLFQMFRVEEFLDIASHNSGLRKESVLFRKQTLGSLGHLQLYIEPHSEGTEIRFLQDEGYPCLHYAVEKVSSILDDLGFSYKRLETKGYPLFALSRGEYDEIIACHVFGSKNGDGLTKRAIALFDAYAAIEEGGYYYKTSSNKDSNLYLISRKNGKDVRVRRKMCFCSHEDTAGLRLIDDSLCLQKRLFGRAYDLHINVEDETVFWEGDRIIATKEMPDFIRRIIDDFWTDERNICYFPSGVDKTKEGVLKFTREYLKVG